MRIGWGEILLIVAVLVLLGGARRLPDLARSLGQAIQEFQRALRGDRGKDDERKGMS